MMAVELLLRAVTNPPHSGMRRKHFWAQGEVVDAKQSPAVWGTQEDPAKSGTNYWIVTVEGIDMSDPLVAVLLEQGIADPGDGDQPVSKRRRWLDLDLLPNRLRVQLRSDKRMTIRTQDIPDLQVAMASRVVERTDDSEKVP